LVGQGLNDASRRGVDDRSRRESNDSKVVSGNHKGITRGSFAERVFDECCVGIQHFVANLPNVEWCRFGNRCERRAGTADRASQTDEFSCQLLTLNSQRFAALWTLRRLKLECRGIQAFLKSVLLFAKLRVDVVLNIGNDVRKV